VVTEEDTRAARGREAQSVFQRVDDVVEREVVDEMFLVPIRGRLADLQELFALNEVGSWLWTQLAGPRTVEELAAAVTDEFDVDESQAREDTASFVEDLLEAGLVREVVGVEA